MEIIWTHEADITFEINLMYLKENWTETEIKNFTKEVFKKLDNISKNPFIGRFDDDYKANRFLITKQITLFYNVIDDKIYLKTFWNNYRKPIK